MAIKLLFLTVLTTFSARAQLIPSGYWNSSSNSPLLYGGTHTKAQCLTAGGAIYTAGASGFLCGFSQASCPGTWTQLANWSTTTVNTCATDCTPCYTSSHVFQNLAAETCTYYHGVTQACLLGPNTCTANVTVVGCY